MKLKPDDDPEFPASFWRGRKGKRAMDRAFKNGGYLEADDCARLWKMTDRVGPPPQRLLLLVNADDVKRLIEKEFPHTRYRQ